MKKRRNKYFLIVGIVSGLILSMLMFRVGTTQVSELAGLAVAQGSKWVNIRDAAIGDNIAAGVLSSALMVFDATDGNFDRLRGSITNGLLVDVTRVAGLPTGSPSDSFANPSSAFLVIGFNMFWNGVNWQRLAGVPPIDNSGFGNLPVMETVMFGFDGTNFDRVRVLADNVANPTLGKLAVLPCIARSTVPTWTDSNIVPCNTSLSGSVRVTQADVPGSGSSVWNVAPSQGVTLFNSQTTGAADTAVTVIISAAVDVRAMLYSLEAQCSAGSSSITVQSGATTIFTSMGNNVPAAPNTYRREWTVPLTGPANTTMTITLASCGVGNTGTLHVQASRG